MKPFKNLIFFSIFFLSVCFLHIKPAQAGTFDAVLGNDGVVTITGSETFPCRPDYGNVKSMASIYYKKDKKISYSSRFQVLSSQLNQPGGRGKI